MEDISKELGYCIITKRLSVDSSVSLRMEMPATETDHE